MDEQNTRQSHLMSRRTFVKKTAVSMTAASVASNFAYARGSDKIRVGLIGCGGRGTGATVNAVNAAKGIELVAMGDLFQDHLDISYKHLSEGRTNWKGEKEPSIGKKFKVKPDTCFTGFDAYKHVLETNVDMVILACPPHFRSKHLRAAIEAGKHVFIEKPVAVDPQGIKSIIESAELAKNKGLSIVAGTQRRHQAAYLEIIKRISDGDIGDILSAQCYWISGPPWWTKGPQLYHEKFLKKWSDLEYQVRNWLHFTWLSGDHIVEQHVHNIDVVNWGLNALPEKAIGMGGRQVRKDNGYGNIWDHFSVQYEYPNGVQVTSMCRQTKECTNMVSEKFIGTKGIAYTFGSSGKIEGQKSYEFDGEAPDPYVQEHTDLIESIRKNKPLNEGKRVAESTMVAILGRMSAYTGRAINYNWALNKSKLNYSLANYEFGVDVPVEPVAMPGITKLV